MTLTAPLLILAMTLALGAGPASARPAGEALIVSPEGPFRTIEAALEAAQDGDLIQVYAGTYAGPLVVQRSVRLEGIDWPVIDGGGRGTVVTLTAPGIVLSGFEIRGSGIEPDRDHAGITLTAPGIRVENNRLAEVLFGIFVAQADDAVLLGNEITSKSQFEQGRRGDAIRVWYSQRPRLESNHVYAARDVVLWYSSDAVLRDNHIEGGRYGIHLMYCDRVRIESNRLQDNSVGIYTMYSTGTVLRENLIRGQRGPSGYALGFKDADDVQVQGNVIVDNRVGVYLDGTPYSPQGFARFDNNLLAFNDVGVNLQPAVRRNVFAGNTL